MRAVVRGLSPAKWFVCKILGTLTPRVYVSAVGGLRLERRPVPQLPGDDWVLCKTRLGGICGTDLSIVFLRQHPATILQRFVSLPVMLGHENVAEIEATGPKVAEFRRGDRVVVDPPLACRARGIDPVCPACAAGRPSICENFDAGKLPATLGLGYNNFTGGSWSEYFVAHVSQLYRLPDGLSDERAIFIDPLACSLHAILVDLPGAGERILVFGAGIIGLSTVALLRALAIRSKVTLTARYPHQVELGRCLGADHVVLWTGDRARSFEELARITGSRARPGRFGIRFLQGGFDRVYDCSGSMAGFADAARLLRPRGTLVVVGTPQLGISDVTPVWFRELKVLGVTGRAVQKFPGETQPEHNYMHVLRLLEQNRLDVDAFALRLYRLPQFRDALLDLRGRGKTGVIKAAFDFR